MLYFLHVFHFFDLHFFRCLVPHLLLLREKLDTCWGHSILMLFCPLGDNLSSPIKRTNVLPSTPLKDEPLKMPRASLYNFPSPPCLQTLPFLPHCFAFVSPWKPCLPPPPRGCVPGRLSWPGLWPALIASLTQLLVVDLQAVVGMAQRAAPGKAMTPPPRHKPLAVCLSC